jgi:hypothetical protein
LLGQHAFPHALSEDYALHTGVRIISFGVIHRNVLYYKFSLLLGIEHGADGRA